MKKEVDNPIYNERKYLPLNADKDVIAKLESIRRCQQQITKENSEIYRHRLVNYKKLISLSSKLIKDLKLGSNSIMISVVLSRLIEAGYFSYKSQFKYNNPKNEIIGFCGIGVVNGKGCCRNITSFNKDVFDELRQFNHCLPCVSFDDLTQEKAFELCANHVLNVIEFERKFYAYDAANGILFNFRTGFMLESIFHRKKEILFNKPSMDMIYNNISKYQVIENIRKYNESSKIPALLYMDYSDMISEASENIRNNRDVLNDFKNEAKPYIKKIVTSKR